MARFCLEAKNTRQRSLNSVIKLVLLLVAIVPYKHLRNV